MSNFDKMEYLKKYAEQDSRLQNPATMTELVANNQGLNFERMMLIQRGVREIHTINVFGQDIPMRVLSMKEERNCRHAAYLEMKNYPEFRPGTNDYLAEHSKILMIKMISLSTSACPEYPKDVFFTEVDIENLPSTTFVDLYNRYKAFELEYNPEINDLSDIQIKTLIGELRDPEKKYQLLIGMSLSQLRAVLNTCLEMLNGQEDNLHLSNLFEESGLTKSATIA